MKRPVLIVSAVVVLCTALVLWTMWHEPDPLPAHDDETAMPTREDSSPSDAVSRLSAARAATAATEDERPFTRRSSDGGEVLDETVLVVLDADDSSRLPDIDITLLSPAAGVDRPARLRTDANGEARLLASPLDVFVIDDVRYERVEAFPSLRMRHPRDGGRHFELFISLVRRLGADDEAARGTVRSTTGEPIDATVRAVCAVVEDGGDFFPHTRKVEVDGRFAIPVRGPECLLTADADGYQPVTTRWKRGDKPLDIALSRRDGTIAGRVTHAGSPVTSFEVLVATVMPKAKRGASYDYSAGGRFPITDEDGRYRVDDAPVGRVSVRVVAPGFLPSEPKDLELKHGAVTLLDFTLQRGRVWSARVVDEQTREGIGDISIGASGPELDIDVGSNITPGTESRDGGTFSLGGLDTQRRVVTFSDPNSRYRTRMVHLPAGNGPLPSEVTLSADQSESYEFEGIGVGFDLRESDDCWVVTRFTETSGAKEAGMAVGDCLVASDGAPLRGITFDAMAEHLRGPAGSTVVVTVSRDSKQLDLTVQRRRIVTR